MIFIYWFIVFLIGLSLTSFLARSLEKSLKLGFAFPVGMGLQAFLMFFLDLSGVKINHALLLLISDIILLLIFGLLAYRKHPEAFKGSPISLRLSGLRFHLKTLDPTWLLLMGVTLIVLFSVVFKTLAWPVFIYDSIAGYDLVAKVISAEGSFHNSIFDPSYPIYTVRCLYPPLVPYNFAFAHIIGQDSSKIVVVFFYLSIFMSFYTLVGRYTTKLAAAFFTMLLVLTPEFAAFSALSSPNPPTTFYSALGTLCLYIWYTEDRQDFFNIGVLLMVFALWTRTETLIFAIPAGLLVLWKSVQKRYYLPVLLYSMPVLAVLFLWQWYLSDILEIHKGLPIIKHLYWDPAKLKRMMYQVQWVSFKPNYYGIVVYLFFALVALNLFQIIRRRDRIALLAMIFGAWGLYMIIFYQIDTTYLPNTTTWITSGYRRGFFYFLPLILFYSATNRFTMLLFRKIQRFTEGAKLQNKSAH